MRRLVLPLLALLLGPWPAAAANDPPLDALLQRALAAYARVDDYRCVFHKRELVRGELVEVRNMEFKFRKPASYYLKYTEGENAGLEAIYVAGSYGNRMEVHLGGFFGFFHLAVDPRGSLALRHNRHAIMEAGIGQILGLMESNYRQAQSDPAAQIVWQGEGRLDGRPVQQVEALFPPGQGYYGKRIQLAIDTALELPVRITVYGWNDEFLEEYRYEQVRLNGGLGALDFSIDNPAYRF